ncbi:MAG TPA: carboxypeptidase-like regulatory domain-containing protein [Candidatus Sulfotelmatobacter sp.]|nr:carboxypeptidase-like regulatory domain-containing protein [Candidatus Sulfotelmatobacter sp.]
MNPNAAKLLFGVALLFVLTAHSVRAQEATATLSGTVTDHTGRVLPNVKVSVKNLTTGQSTEAETNEVGLYNLTNLVPGDYEVSVASAEGTKTQPVTLSAGASQKIDLVLDAVPPLPEAPAANPSAPAPAEALPNAPSSSKTEPSLEDLGFSKTETQSNAAQQALLDKRTRMLKIHQRMGLITTIPLIATVVTSLNAGGKNESSATRDLHVALGSLTGDLYGITAWYAIRAPRIAGTETRGPIRFHKAMAWIHGPGMILTPILGAMAFNQKNNGQKVHGIAQAHGPVAIVTAGAFGAALLSVSLKF